MNYTFTDVLLIDDDPVTNFLNECLLQEMKVTEHIAIARHGVQALEYIEKHWCMEGNFKSSSLFQKLILLDINMPVMDADVNL